MHSKSSGRAVVACLSLIASLLAMALSPAPAGAATVLPNGFGAIAVDATHGRVYISSPTANLVTVLDLNGAVVATVANELGANSLLVDGDALYIATTAGVVDVISTITLTKTASYGSGVLTAPTTLAKAGGRIWTTTSSCRGAAPQLASIDPVSGAVTTQTALPSLSYCPQLVASPTDPNVLLGFDEGLSPATIVKLDVSTGVPTVVREQRETMLSNLAQIAFSPDGTTFVAASGAPYEIDQFRVSDLLPDGIVYPSGAYPNAVASAAGNGGLVAGGRNAAYTPDVDVHRLGDPSKRLLQTDFGGSANTLYRRGLAFSPDGSKLFAVSGDTYAGAALLNVLAVGSNPLPTDATKGFGAIAVDSTRNRVYVSSPSAHAIRVFDLAGTYLATINGEAGANSLLVDGTTLYVAATNAGVIDAIDTATLTRTRSLGYGSVVKPNSLVKAGDRLWTTNGACASSSTGLTAIDPVSGATTTYASSTFPSACPMLTTSPVDPNLVLAFDAGSSPATITKLDVSSGAPVVVAQQREPQIGNLKQLTFSPDGTTFYAASGSPYEIDEFRTSDLLPTGVVYPTGYYPNAVATTASAGKLLAAGRSASTNPATNVFRLGYPGSQVLQTSLTASENLYDRGLAFAPDASALYTVSGDQYGTQSAVLRTYAIAVPTAVWVGSWVNPTVVGQPAAFTAEVDLVGGGRATAGTVTFRDGPTVIGSAPVGTDGTATLGTSTLSAGTHSVAVSFAGSGYAPATSSTVVQTVNSASTAGTVASSANPAIRNATVVFTATIAVASPGAGTPTGSVSFYDGATLLATKPMAAATATYATSTLSVATHSITVRYSGDANFTASTSPVLAQVIKRR